MPLQGAYKRGIQRVVMYAVEHFSTEHRKDQTGTMSEENDDNTLSHSFELRQFRNEAEANGPTDFKGETSIFDTEERVDYLRDYADYGSRFFDDPDLDTEVVTDEEVDDLVDQLKPQPMPDVRTRFRLNGWKRLGYREGQRQEEQRGLQKWTDHPSVEVKDEVLQFVEQGQIEVGCDEQTWRMRVEWRQRGPVRSVVFLDDGQNTVEWNPDGIDADQWQHYVAEVDLKEGRWNLYRNDEPVLDWETLPDGTERIDGMRVAAEQGAELSMLRVVGYTPTDVVRRPYDIETVVDEDFAVRPDPSGWQKPGYDDGEWETTDGPLVHGGERNADEDLFLRTTVHVDEDFDKAWLDIETLDPGGEVWINGELVCVARDRRPRCIEIGDFVERGADNLVAVRVYAFDSTIAEEESSNLPHSGNDTHIGWFAGRMHIDLTHHAWVDDVFVHTLNVSPNRDSTPRELGEEFTAETAGQLPETRADSATVKVETTVSNRDSEDRWTGHLRVRLFPWFPDESDEVAAETILPVDCCEWRDEELEAEIEVPEPQLWTWQSPALYKVEVTLMDEDQNPVDDEVVTTGIRTISQEGGVFRLNNRPEMLNGAQIFGLRSPLDRLAAWQRRCPVEWLVREIAQIRRMNANAMRIHVHAWSHLPPARNINDVRLAEIGDQLGIMFYWPTTSWIRSGTPWGVDLEGLPEYVRQVRNHPSIALWELSNHPTVNQKYDRGAEGWNEYYQEAHDIVYPLDPSRLIAPTAIVGEGSPETPALELPGMVRGEMDAYTGMGVDWSTLRHSIAERRDYFEERKDTAYFNFEHEESIGQPNWNLSRGKPWHEVMSYEWDADEGSIGRKLAAEEWRESQAWHAMSAFESMRKQREMGVDGFSWCCLHGGPNTATYKKPLIDYMGHAKLCWHANRMAFQRVLAGSDDVDIVYGPDDWIHPVVQNLGTERIVDVEVRVQTLDGEEVARREYERVKLPAGRSNTTLPAFRPPTDLAGNHAVEYVVRSVEE